MNAGHVTAIQASELKDDVAVELDEIIEQLYTSDDEIGRTDFWDSLYSIVTTIYSGHDQPFTCPALGDYVYVHAHFPSDREGFAIDGEGLVLALSAASSGVTLAHNVTDAPETFLYAGTWGGNETVTAQHLLDAIAGVLSDEVQRITQATRHLHSVPDLLLDEPTEVIHRAQYLGGLGRLTDEQQVAISETPKWKIDQALADVRADHADAIQELTYDMLRDRFIEMLDETIDEILDARP